jgi:hypothetical protein
MVIKYFISLKFTFEHGQIKEDSNGAQSEPALHGFERHGFKSIKIKEYG